MELSFDKLLEFDIKRLSRPKFKHDISQFLDPVLFESESTGTEGSEWRFHNNDVSYENISSDQMLSYSSSFGKILMGEEFSAAFTIMNNSATFALTDIRMRVFAQFQNPSPAQKGNNDIILLDHKVDNLNMRQQMSFPLRYRVSQAGTYHLTIEVSYSSKYFTE